MRRVVITGIGIVSSIGNNAAEVEASLRAGKSGIVAAPDYLARHGRPQHPAELANHECLGYTAASGGQIWQFMVAGQRIYLTSAMR